MVSKQKYRSEKIETPYDEEPRRADSRIWWVVGLVFGLLLTGASTFLAVRNTFGGFEYRVFHFINTWPDSLRPVFLAATIVPESLWIGVAAVIVTFLLKMYRAAWELAGATVAGYGIVFIAKHLVGRPRPLGLVHDPIVRAVETGNGFPSGHTMIITVVILTLFPYLPKGWRWVPFFIFIPAMALSRVYLGVHMPLDVVGGFAIGVTVVCAMRSLPQPLRRWLRIN